MASYHDYQESLGQDTTTSGTHSSKVSSSTSLTNGTTYAIFWSCEGQNNNTSGAIEVRLRDHTGSANLQVVRHNPKDTTDYIIHSGVATYTASASATREFRIEYSRINAGTSAIRNARLLIFALDGSDFFATSTGSSNTTSGSMQDKVSLSLTGATAGDYLLAGSLIVTANNDGTECQGLNTSSTAINAAGPFWVQTGTTILVPYVTIWRETLTGASATAKLQYRSTDGGSSSVQDAYLVAIRTASLGANAYTLDDADDGGTSSVAGDSETLSGDGVDTVGGDVLVIAAATYRGNSTTVSSEIDFREASTTMITSFHEDRGTAAVDITALIAFKSASANDPETWKWRRRSESGSGTTTTVRYAAIAVLGLSAGAEVFNQVLSATVTTTKSIRRTVSKRVSVTKTATASIRKTVSKTLADSVSATASIYKTATKILADSVSATASMTLASVWGKVLNTSATVSASMQRQTTKFVSKTVTATASMRRGTAKILARSVTTTASMVRSVAKLLSVSVSASASVLKTVGKGVFATCTATASMIRGLAVNKVLSATVTATASLLPAIGKTLIATVTTSASMVREISKLLTARVSYYATMRWAATLLAAIRGDRPNWNQCARCGKKVRPNKLIMQTQWIGPRMVATGARVCSSCLDVPNPSDRWTGYVEIGGDPRPVPNPRPRRD